MGYAWKPGTTHGRSGKVNRNHGDTCEGKSEISGCLLLQMMRPTEMQIIPYIRHYQPEVILANTPQDRHPDHGKAAQLVKTSNFISGLRKVQTSWEGETQKAWRAQKVFHGIQDDRLEPDFVVDITPYFDQRKEAILAFESQFFNPEYSKKEPQSYISSMDFLNFLEARSRDMGHLIGATFGEGFVASAHLEAHTPMDFIRKK